MSQVSGRGLNSPESSMFSPFQGDDRIPDEITQLILVKLDDVRSFIAASQVCRNWNNLANWHLKFIEDFSPSIQRTYTKVDYIRESTIRGGKPPVFCVECKGENARIGSIHVAPNNKIIASYSDNKIRIWTTNGECQEVFNSGGSLIGLDGDNIITANCTFFEGRELGFFKIWDQKGNCLLTSKKAHNGQVDSVIIKAGKIYSSSYNEVNVWDTEGNLLFRIEEYSIRNAGIFEDGKIVTKTSHGKVAIWNENGIKIANLDIGGSLPDVKIVNDRIITRSSGGLIKVWNKEGICIGEVQDGRAWIEFAATSDGLIVTAPGSTLTQNDCAIKIWDQDGRLLVNLVGHTGAVIKMFIHKDKIVSATHKDVKIWDFSGKCLTTLFTGTIIHDVRITQDEKIVTISNQMIIDISQIFQKGIEKELWDKDGKCINTSQFAQRGPLEEIGIWEGKLISWSQNETMIWDIKGKSRIWPRPTIQKNTEENAPETYKKVFDIYDIFKDSMELKLWDQNGTLLNTIKGEQQIPGTFETNDGRFILGSSYFSTVTCNNHVYSEPKSFKIWGFS